MRKTDDSEGKALDSREHDLHAKTDEEEGGYPGGKVCADAAEEAHEPQRTAIENPHEHGDACDRQPHSREEGQKSLASRGTLRRERD
jgi:hypothetical protein